MGDIRREKLKEIFEQTADSGLQIKGNLDDLDYYKLFCYAGDKKHLHTLYGNLVCMFNARFEETDSIVIIFSIPINKAEESGAKNVAERIAEVVSETEKCFITLDYVKTDEIKEDKVVYVLMVKKLNNGG